MQASACKFPLRAPECMAPQSGCPIGCLGLPVTLEVMVEACMVAESEKGREERDCPGQRAAFGAARRVQEAPFQLPGSRLTCVQVILINERHSGRLLAGCGRARDRRDHP